MPTPSPMIVPSAASENGLQSPDWENAGVLEKHMYIITSLSASTPPVNTRSDSCRYSRCNALCNADSELAHAASTTKLQPPRSSRLATRPATTLPSRPGNVLSIQAG